MKFTVKQLATKANISEGTIRSWIMKPEAGKTYSAENINYTNLYEKLHKYYEKEDEFEKLCGCKIEDIDIMKAERTTKAWKTVDELEKGKSYALHNYSLKTELVYLGIYEHLNQGFKRDIYIFMDAKSKFKAYSKTELEADNIKIEEI